MSNGIFKENYSDKLTGTPESHKNSESGMAHFAGTGPRGLTCRECQFWHWKGNKRAYSGKTGTYHGLINPARCSKYKSLTGQQGSPVADNAAACRHFLFNKDAPARFNR